MLLPMSYLFRLLIFSSLLSIAPLNLLNAQTKTRFAHPTSCLIRDFTNEIMLYSGIDKSLEKQQEVIALSVSATEKDWSNLEKFENLKYLYLDETFTVDSYYLSKTGLSEVFKHITALKQLEFISICDPRILPYMKTMKNLRGIKFNRFDAALYQSESGNFPELQLLILNDPKIHTITFSFTGFDKLEQLEIYSTALLDLPATVGNLSNLRVLNVLCGKAVTVPDSYSKLKKLSYLRITGSSVLNKFPSCITAMESLSVLDIDLRNVKEIPEEVSNLKQLKSLTLNECQKIKSLPNGISEMNMLEEIYLSDADHLNDVMSLLKMSHPFLLLLNRCNYTEIAKALKDCAKLKAIVVPNGLPVKELDKIKAQLGENRVLIKDF